MLSHVRIVSWLWLIAGLALVGWAVWGLVTEEHSTSVVASWLIVLTYGAVAIAAGALLPRGKLLGRILVRVAASLALLYAAMWLFLGGVEDAGGYWPGIVIVVALSLYTLLMPSRPTPNAA